MLRGLSSNEFQKILTWAPLFKEQLLRQRSLISLLNLVHQSQSNQSRLLWYQTCFFFASLSKISERSFFQLFSKRWQFSFFFFLTNQSFFFRSLEYYFNNIDYLKFSSKYFRGTSLKLTKNLLPYSHFHLRAPSSLYLVLWYHSEQVRMRFFNDYVKSHDFINTSMYLPRRFRFQKTIFSYRVRSCRKMLLRFFFLMYSHAERYRVFEFKSKALSTELPSFSLSSVMYPALAQTPSFQLALATKKFPLKPLGAIRQRFVLGVNYLQMNLWSNNLLASDPLSFKQMVRMDWTHFHASFPIFVICFRLRPWLYRWTDRLIKKFVALIFKEYQRNSFDYFFLNSLSNCLLPLKSSYRFYFTWWILELRVSRFWNYWILDKWSKITVFSHAKTSAKMFPLNYQLLNYIKFFRELLVKFAVFGDFKMVSTFFTKNILPLDFLFWRISSNGQIYRDFFMTRAFSLTSVFRKLTLDHYALQRTFQFRAALETLMLRSGFFMCAGITWQGNELNPWCLNPPYTRLPDGAYHPLEPRWSFANQVFMIAVRRFILSVFRRSRFLSLFAFFLFFHRANVVPQSRFLFFFKEIVNTTVAFRRSYSLYKTTSLKQFRRYPHKVFVHSRVDPSFRARWFSFADRMRRAGIKRSDLPYYPESDATDIVADLTKRNSKFFWSRTPRYWIINPLT